MDMKRFFLYAIVIAALALAGCGSDGNGGMPAMPDPAPDPDPMPTAIDLSSLTAGMMLGAAGAQTIQPGMTYESGDVMFTCPAGGSACMVTVNANGTATYDANGGTPMVANTQDAIDAKNTADAAAVAAATKAAGTKMTAIMTEAAQTADSNLGGSDPDGDGSPNEADEIYTLTIARDRDGTKVTIADPGNAADEDPKFMQAMDLGDGLTMHTRTMEADDDGNVVEEVVMVKTDIEAPTAVAFDKWEGRASDGTKTMPQMLTVVKDDGLVPDDGETADALTVDQTSAGVLALVKSSSFTSGTGAVLTFDMDDTNTPDMDEAYETAGTYNGAMGTYRCAGTADCTVTLDTMGMITDMSAGWIFVPDEGATSDQPDYDYLHYGFWLKNTTDEDGVLTYNEVQTFAGSSLLPATQAVTGTAKYEGDAVGVYVREIYKTTDGKVDTATSGHFTADVNLTANFGTPTSIAADDHNTITGTISNFVLSGGEDASGWGVNVEAGITGTNVLENGTAKGGGAGDGSFTGTFHGPDSMEDDQGTEVQLPPEALVGEFNADFSNGAVAGAYGARKQMMMEQ